MTPPPDAFPPRARILYCRIPGLLAAAARTAHKGGGAEETFVISDNGTVRDTCLGAYASGVRPAMNVAQARRLCPASLIVPVEDLDVRVMHPLSRIFWNHLAELSPVIEPEGTDAAFAVLEANTLPVSLPQDIQCLLGTGFAPITGMGRSRHAARALAECGLETSQYPECDSRWLWPEDPQVGARLYRLGLDTFGAVAAIGESALVYQFGKTGRLLYLRSLGRDLTPIRPLWPPPRAEAALDFSFEPVQDEGSVRESLIRLSRRLSRHLKEERRHARRLSIYVKTESGESAAEWIVPFPVQSEADVLAALRRLRGQVTITAPVVCLSVVAEELDLPIASTGSLFDARAAERRMALESTRRKLRSRYGIRGLRSLGEITIPRREERRQKRKERLQT